MTFGLLFNIEIVLEKFWTPYIITTYRRYTYELWASLVAKQCSCWLTELKIVHLLLHFTCALEHISQKILPSPNYLV